MKDSKQKALHRIKIIQGHIKSIEKMITEDSYCVDVIHQSNAVQKSLKNLSTHILSNHLDTCLINQIKEGKEDQAVEEIKQLYEMKQ